MEKKKIIKQCIFFSVIAILILIVILIMLRYQVEGEKNLPYKLSKILLVSTVDGKKNENTENLWDINISQINDVFIYIDSEGNPKETIKEISLENFNIIKAPQKGNVQILRATGELDNLYSNSVQDYLNDKIVYQGAKIDDLKSLEISNNGGVIGFRLALNDLGNFLSDDENVEVIYDGRLLSNLDISIQEIQLTMNFDIIIKTSDNINYKGTISMDLPVRDIIELGTSKIEITNFSNVIFKRI